MDYIESARVWDVGTTSTTTSIGNILSIVCAQMTLHLCPACSHERALREEFMNKQVVLCQLFPLDIIFNTWLIETTL
jgi:hypothetical protein